MYGEGNRGGGYGGGYGGGSRGGFGGDGVAPVSVGEEIDVRIEAVGEKGDGIARKRGFVLFIPNTREGDEVRVRITKVLRKVGFAEVIGQAQSAPPADKAPRAREQPEPVRPMAPAPAPEDSEDFGEEEPEPVPETPIEEPDSDEMEAPPLPPEEGADDEENKEA